MRDRVAMAGDPLAALGAEPLADSVFEPPKNSGDETRPARGRGSIPDRER